VDGFDEHGCGAGHRVGDEVAGVAVPLFEGGGRVGRGAVAVPGAAGHVPAVPLLEQTPAFPDRQAAGPGADRTDHDGHSEIQHQVSHNRLRS
jgi:hypothetical protein